MQGRIQGGRGGRTRRAPPLKLEKIWFFVVKSWFFTRNTSTIFAPPSAIGKNKIFWRKIVIFHTKYPQNFRASLRSAQFLCTLKLPICFKHEGFTFTIYRVDIFSFQDWVVNIPLQYTKCISVSGAFQGRIQDFKLGRVHLKKIAPSGGRRENFGGISCEKSRFYAKKSYFFRLHSLIYILYIEVEYLRPNPESWKYRHDILWRWTPRA
jgi:hypothetical protein